MLEIILNRILFDADLVVSWRNVGFIRDDPDLKKFYGLLCRIFFTVHNSGSGRHHLDIAFFDDSGVAHIVAVTQLTFQRNRDNFHISVRMSAESHSALNKIVIQNSENAKMDPFLILIISKKRCDGFLTNRDWRNLCCLIYDKLFSFLIDLKCLTFLITQISSFQNPCTLMYDKNEKLRRLPEFDLFELMIKQAY